MWSVARGPAAHCAEHLCRGLSTRLPVSDVAHLGCLPFWAAWGIYGDLRHCGHFHSEDRLDYTIIGGQVNAASRLESLAEPDEILIAHGT
ncbi:MAG: hypothetical protein FJZ47_01400 [Candidatus Tectomicrobia bacterium]|uniref:Guanylate cyclase domain-containing protein n=1 Tax=Tectimicrobiota bacterium TaxID=2528274 RepID=A0A938B239_UNCTE|nr:hypothetical protein [Candidatus Tectomicrobia bacterium]